MTEERGEIDYPHKGGHPAKKGGVIQHSRRGGG